MESPTHALRADGDPSAKSASATYITLAEEHPYNCNLEIILHLSGEATGGAVWGGEGEEEELPVRV